MTGQQKQVSESSLRILSKISLSLIAIFYILMVVIYPNGSSYLGRTIGNALLPVANTAGLNTTWNFFSPDPAHTMYFAYHVYFENEHGVEIKDSLSGYLPTEKNQIVTDASRRRMLYAMRFLMLDERRLNLLMAPWLCQQNPGASRVSIRSVVEKIPLMDEAIAKMNFSAESLRQEVDSRSTLFDCHGPQDEVRL